MTKFFSKYKIIFYLINFLLIILYIFPGSLLGCIFLNDCKIQPQITADFIISTNHLYTFAFISVIGLYTFTKSNQIKYLIFYLIFLSIILEIFHLIIPERSFQFVDLFGNLLGVIIVIFIYSLINKYGVFKK
jgi:VanZ family protein